MDYQGSINPTVSGMTAPPPKRTYEGSECLFAWLCVLGGYLLSRAFADWEIKPLGLLLTVSLLTAVTVVTLAVKKAKFDLHAIASAVLTVVFAASLLVTDSGFVNLLSLACSAAAYCYFVYCATGNRTEKGFSDCVFADLFSALLRYPFAKLGDLYRAMFSGRSKGTKGAARVLAGLAIAVIPTAAAVGLLSYDDGFMSLLDDAFSFLDDFDFGSQFGSVIAGLLTAMYLFGLYACATGDQKKPYDLAAARAGREKRRIIPLTTTAAALLPLCTVYVFFFVSQWDYYVSGFNGALPEDVATYAEYARNGFFELCAVSVINFFILISVSLWMRRDKTGERICLKIANILLSVMTLVLIGTAMAKMFLYIDTYGLTLRRVLASWLMILLAIVFLLIVFKQILSKFKLISASAVAVTVMVGILAFSNVNGRIANYNADMYLQGKHAEVDVQTLYNLDEPAVPALVKLAEYAESDPEASYTQSNLRSKLEVLRRKHDGSFFAFSFPASRAEEAFDRYFEE